MPTPLAELPIRPLTLRDLAPCVALAEDRGWPPEEHRWRLLLTAGRGHGIDAPDGDGLAGVCTVISYGTPGRRDAELAVIGMLLVARQYGGQGLGRRLMTHVMREVDGSPLALYATPLGRPLYEKLGFVPAGLSVTVQGAFRPPSEEELSLPPGLLIRPATADDLSPLARLDAEVFGVDRTLMITRLPAFAERLRIATVGSSIVGYAMAWNGGDTDVIGPLVAPDTATAKALVSALATATRRPLRTHIDGQHDDLLSWLKEHGLDSVATCTTMTHGILDLPGDPSRRFAPLSLATC